MADKPDNSDHSANLFATISKSVVLMVMFGVIGAVIRPEQSATIFSFIGGLIVILVTVLQKQQENTHAMNSRLDQLVELREEVAATDAVTEERARVKSEEQEESNDAT